MCSGRKAQRRISWQDQAPLQGDVPSCAFQCHCCNVSGSQKTERVISRIVQASDASGGNYLAWSDIGARSDVALSDNAERAWCEVFPCDIAVLPSAFQ